MKPTPIKDFFGIVNVILEKKPYPTDEDIKKHCNQYMVGTMLSCDIQFTGIAHKMAQMKISNKMYFDCLYHGLTKCKRFIKWNATKAKKEQDIQYLMEYYGISQSNAKTYEQLIDKDELTFIRDYFEKRGKV
jgi:hypothetical protein